MRVLVMAVAAVAPTAAGVAAAGARLAAPPAVATAPPDVGVPPSDAARTASGIAMKVLAPGRGPDRPAGNDCVKVNFTGWRRDGGFLTSSSVQGGPALQCLRAAMPGVAEALRTMAVGEKRRVWIPAALTLGQTGGAPVGQTEGRSLGQTGGAPVGQTEGRSLGQTGGAPVGQTEGRSLKADDDDDKPPPGADVTFDLELVDIVKAPPTPADLAAPPRTATRTESGLAFRVLRKGTGTKHPSVASRVTLHFSGWTKDGTLFETTVMSGHPAVVVVGETIPGWREGLLHMMAGEKARFWIPGALAYGDTPGRRGIPTGPLVYDIELLAVQ